MISYFDAHCHLENCIRRPAGAICNAVTESDWFDIASLSLAPHIYGAIGIHPWVASFVTDGWEVRMARLLAERPDLMIGEIGLDANRGGMDAQRHVFAVQMDIAAAVRRTVHIHCVGAWARMLEILCARRLSRPVMMHSFAGSVETMKLLLSKYDTYFSVAPFILNPRHHRMREVAAVIPINRILVESDGANWFVFMATVREIARLRDRPLAEMARILYDNSKRMLVNG